VLLAWAGVTVPFALLCAGVGVLAPAAVATRRRAILMGALLVPLVLFGYVSWSVSFWTTLTGLWRTDSTIALLPLSQSAILLTAQALLVALQIVPLLWLAQTAWIRLRR